MAEMAPPSRQWESKRGTHLGGGALGASRHLSAALHCEGLEEGISGASPEVDRLLRG